MPTAALDGLRVLDFSRVLAGPLCSMILGDLGADVIKVENPAGGDDTRHWGPPWLGDYSAYYLSVNRNKRSITLNLKTEKGRDLARQLAAESHVVIENFKVGQMAAFGMGYDDLHAINPGLVYCSISGFGQSGPYSNRPGYDFVIQAMSGLMSITGPAGNAPHKVGVATADILAALYAANAIQAALHYSQATGEGQYIDVSLLNAQIAGLINVASGYLVSGHTPESYGNAHPNIVPYQTFRASDGEFALAVGNDRQFIALCDVIERPWLAHEPQYATNPQRVAHRHKLVLLLKLIFAEKPRQYWINTCLSHGIPAGPINDIAEALHNEHADETGLIEETRLHSGDALHHIASPMHLSETPTETRLPPPALGEHTADVLQTVLNLSEADITALHEDGIV